ncbi:CDP-glycerol glycerophosphotransferase family protein [Rhodohalobacter halophilus]|uniref:CDP-glycerol glycerophosphotransferase family protein n=1 Tax=Rhodohalobacter halophilus TaxID=1812810 RepID=UPI00159F2BE1
MPERSSYIRQLFWFSISICSFFTRKQKSLVVLTSFHGDGFRGNTKEIFEKLADHPFLKPIWLSRNKALVHSIQSKHGSESALLTYSIKGLSTLASAGVILLTHVTSDYPFMFLPRRAVIIQSYHGLPTKTG